jgi:hypothetical protein
MPVLDEDRITIRDENSAWVFGKIEEYSEFADFDCGNDDLNDYIKNAAELHQEELIAETYGLSFLDEQGRRLAPVAFLSLSNDAIALQTRQKKNIPDNLRNYKEMPAIKIGRLGVRKHMQRNNIGTLLLNIVRFMITTQNRTGCRFITANAEPDVEVFYMKNDFKKLRSKLEKGKYTFYSDLKRFSMNNSSG